MPSRITRGTTRNVAALICLIATFHPAAAATTINVTKFGAKCDGKFNDTAALQLAAQAVPEAGGVLQFSPGICVVSAATPLKSNTRVAGQNTTIRNLPPAAWAHGVGGAFVINGATNVTIEGMRFSWQHGFYNGGVAHIIEATNASHVVIRHNVSDGGGDFAAFIGSSNIVMAGNQVTEVDNSCFDSWGGARQVRVIDNRCSTTTRTHPGVGAVQFTGIRTDFGPAINTGFYAARNDITINTPNGQAFEINGSPKGGANQDITIEDNHIVIAAHAWGVLVTYAAHGKIAHNRIDMSVADILGAIYVAETAPDWEISDNIARAVPGIKAAIFANKGAGGRFIGNRQTLLFTGDRQ